MHFIQRHPWLVAFGGLIGALGIFALVFRWDWLLPLVEARASATLGRPVTAEHLRVALGETARIELDAVTVGNPTDWPGGGTLAVIERVGIDLSLIDYLRTSEIVLPVIDLQAPKFEARQLADGRANWIFPSAGPGPEPKLGTLRIAAGLIHVIDEKLRADFNVSLETKDSADGTGQIVAKAEGKYANQPILAQFAGGALLSLRDAARPYPIDLTLANGPTRLTLKGAVRNPLVLGGADLRLDMAGPDMALLLPLTGIAIPKTPPYHVSGKLDYADGVVQFQNFTGRVGSSDLAGTVKVDTKPTRSAPPGRPVIVADLQSNLVDLKDLGGFIGAEPGDASKGTKAPVRNTGRVLPSDPISLPKLNAADVHLRYRALKIQGRRQPLDTLTADLDIVDGNVTLKPLSIGIGQGHITADIALDEKANQLHARATISFVRVDLEKLLAATGFAHGAGVVGGRAVIDGTGRSMAEILGDGNGELKLFMAKGGDLSALLVDLSGLEFGNALLSALGLPNRARIECMITDFGLNKGVATVRTAMLDTSEARVIGAGSVNLHDETLHMTLETDAKHFSVGSLNTPINVRGTLASPSVLPQVGPLALRGAAAVGLGIVGTPLAALLPTIQFGTGEDGACARLIRGEPAKTK
jgi:uncharacterized protein involved in outer membrane biogenesis